MQKPPRVVFLVMACSGIPKYDQLSEAIHRTWGRACGDGSRAAYRFFCGDAKGAKADGGDGRRVFLEGVGEDYESASEKQWRGLEHIYRNSDPDFVWVVGLDTFVCVANALEFLEGFQPDAPLYIGGHGDVRTVAGEQVYFHSGGPGFILSREALRRIATDDDNNLAGFHAKWKGVVKDAWLECACDVAMGWYARTYGLTTVDVENRFYHCNVHGWPCHTHAPAQPATALACHLMQPDDMDRAMADPSWRRAVLGHAA